MAKIKLVNMVKTKYGTFALHFTNHDGMRRRLSVGSNQQHAMRMEIKFLDWLLDGKDPELEMELMARREKLERVTLREFFPTFMERHGIFRSKSMQRSYHISFRHICRSKELADSPLGKLSKALVIEFMHARIKQDNVSPATVNKDAAFIKVMMSKAEEWAVIQFNPLRRLKLFPDTQRREVNVRPEQIAELIRLLDLPIDDIVTFLVSTGFRKENVLGLKIETVRFHDLTPTGEVVLLIKGGRRELFPLGPAAVEILRRVIGDRTEGYVFINPLTGTRYHSINKSFNRVVRQLNLTAEDGSKLRIHDLRHAHATWLHRAGVSLDELRFLLGHKDRSTTDRYTHVDRLACGDALKLLPDVGAMAQKKSPAWATAEAS